MDPRLEVRMTKTMGRSAFARAPIAAGEQLTMDYEFDGGPDDPEWA